MQVKNHRPFKKLKTQLVDPQKKSRYKLSTFFILKGYRAKKSEQDEPIKDINIYISHDKKKVNKGFLSKKQTQSIETSIAIRPDWIFSIEVWSQFFKLKQRREEKKFIQKKINFFLSLQRGRAEGMQMNSRWMGNFYDRIDLYICSEKKNGARRRKKMI